MYLIVESVKPEKLQGQPIKQVLTNPTCKNNHESLNQIQGTPTVDGKTFASHSWEFSGSFH